MNLKATVAALFVTAAISPAFAAPSTGVTECDQLLREMAACVKVDIKTTEQQQQLDTALNDMATQLKTMIDGGMSKAEAIEGCNVGRAQLREQGCE